LSDPAVMIRDLAVWVRRRCILELSELEVATGEFLAVLGPNGAGKSTLLKVIAGLVRPRRGRVMVLGCDLGSLPWWQQAAWHARIGYVPQHLASRPELPLTAREVVAIGRSGLRGLGRPLRRQDWAIVDAWIERLGLAAVARQPYGALSGGEQRKTLIARALAQAPAMLLLDEPSANLDLNWREQIVRLCGQLHAELKLTVLLVCHELEAIPPTCRRVVLLDAGRCIASGAPEEVLTTEHLQRLYGPGLDVIHGHGRHCVVPSGIGQGQPER